MRKDVLKGVGRFEARTAEMVVGNVAYNGDDGAMELWVDVGRCESQELWCEPVEIPMSTLSNFSYL
jgi:hypothetical protein